MFLKLPTTLKNKKKQPSLVSCEDWDIIIICLLFFAICYLLSLSHPLIVTVPATFSMQITNRLIDHLSRFRPHYRSFELPLWFGSVWRVPCCCLQYRQTIVRSSADVGAPCCCLFHCPTVPVSQGPGHGDRSMHMQLYTQHVNTVSFFIPSTLKTLFPSVTSDYCIDSSFLHWFNHFNAGL